MNRIEDSRRRSMEEKGKNNAFVGTIRLNKQFKENILFEEILEENGGISLSNKTYVVSNDSTNVCFVLRILNR